MHHSKTLLNPYLTYNGNCDEAMNFYKEALDGELELLLIQCSTIEVQEDYKHKVLHASIRFGYGVLIAADDMPDQEITSGNTCYLSFAAVSEEENERYFKNLYEGG